MGTLHVLTTLNMHEGTIGVPKHQLRSHHCRRHAFSVTGRVDPELQFAQGLLENYGVQTQGALSPHFPMPVIVRSQPSSFREALLSEAQGIHHLLVSHGATPAFGRRQRNVKN